MQLEGGAQGKDYEVDPVHAVGACRRTPAGLPRQPPPVPLPPGRTGGRQLLYAPLPLLPAASLCCAVALLLQVRKISVKQAVSPILFNNLKTAVKGGLYDPAYGPMDNKERCVGRGPC